jgi:transposase
MARGDLTDEQWSRLEAVLPPLPKMGREPRDRRQCFDGIWWRARTGSPWRGGGTRPDTGPSGVGGWPPARLRPRNVQTQEQGRMPDWLLKQARGIATRYDKLAVRCEATVQLTLIRQAL